MQRQNLNINTLRHSATVFRKAAEGGKYRDYITCRETTTSINLTGYYSCSMQRPAVAPSKRWHGYWRAINDLVFIGPDATVFFIGKALTFQEFYIAIINQRIMFYKKPSIGYSQLQASWF